MNRLLLAGILLISMMGSAAYSASKGLNVPGDLTVTGTIGATGKIFAPAGINAVGGTVEADHFIGEGSLITNVNSTISNYSLLSGTASQAADLVVTGQSTGDALVFDGSHWVKLPIGNFGQTLISKGLNAMPSWEGVAWLRIVATAESILSPTIPTDSLSLLSDSRIYMDSSQTKYLYWDSTAGRFEFNDDVYLYGTIFGSGAGLTSLNASQLTSGVVSAQRGGLASDISGATRGDILFYNGSNWVRLGAGTSGYVLKTQGTLANPVWGAGGGTVTLVDTTGSLTGGPITGIGTLDVANGGITAAKLLTGSVTSGAIADGTIAAVDFGTGVVTSGAIADGTIAAIDLGSGVVTSGAIAVGTITAANMAAGSVTIDVLLTENSPTSGTFLRYNGSNMDWATTGSITGSLEVDYTTINHNINGSLEVIPGGIDASRLATGSVTSGAIADGTIAAVDFGTGVVTSGAIASNTITAANLASGSVTGGAIALNTITAANMGTNSITQAAIAAGVPGNNNFLRWNGSAMDWADSGTITGSLEMDNMTIGLNINSSMEVRDGGITSAKIANNTISASNMGTNSVTADALADDSVDTNAIVNLNVTGGKIANTTIDGTKLTTGINISTTGYVTAETVKATYLYGNGSSITGVTATNAATANYATLSGTASYAADLNIPGQITGSALVFDGTHWGLLVPGEVGETLISKGVGNMPSFEGVAWIRTSVTGETVLSPAIPTDSLSLLSDSKIYFDSSRTKFFGWNSGTSRFELNADQYTSGIYYGNGSGLTNLTASNISSGILGLARGGLGFDSAGAGHQGNILYHNGTTWAELTPGTSGYVLSTQGPGANPVWVNDPGSVSLINSGRGLIGGPITTTGTLTIDTNVVVTTTDAQTLSNKTINSGLIDGTTAINTTGVATFTATGRALTVANDGYIGGKLLIGTDTGFNDMPSTEVLKVDATGLSTSNVISGLGDINSWLQLNIKNKNAGSDATSDLVAMADNGDDTNNFIDMGICSSVYNYPDYWAGGPDDTYLYSTASNFVIGNTVAGKTLQLATGGEFIENVRLTILSDGQIGIGTTEPVSLLTVAGTIEMAPNSGGGVKFNDGTILYSATMASANIADGSITAAKMGTGSVTSDAIADLTIVGTDLATNINISTTGYVTAASVAVNGQMYSKRFALTDGPTIAVDWSNGNTQSVTIAASRIFTFANGQDGGKYILIIKQGGAGNFTATWPGTARWPGAITPTLTKTAGKSDYIGFIYNGVDSKYDGVAFTPNL